MPMAVQEVCSSSMEPTALAGGQAASFRCRICPRTTWMIWLKPEALSAAVILIAFVVIDYITGVMCAISDKSLSSEVGFRGICRKVLIFILVEVGNLLDVYILREAGVLRTAVIFFYLSNEGVSLLENASRLGLPIPEKLKEILQQLHDKGGNDHEST